MIAGGWVGKKSLGVSSQQRVNPSRINMCTAAIKVVSYGIFAVR